jgi:DNA mismatch repair protein MutS
MSTNILKEYMEIYIQNKKEHGDKTVLLFQIGKFYEIYTVLYENEKIGNAEEIANNLELKLGKKDSSKEFSCTNAYFTGFPTFSSKYINKLINNGFIVVVYDQIQDGTSIKRFKKAIYTKTVTPLDSDFESDDNYLYVGVITMNKNSKYKYGYTLFNNKTNEIIVNELNNVTLKDINQEKCNIETMYNIQQMIEKTEDCLDKKYFDNEYCNLLIREVYKDVNFGLLDPIQYFFNKQVNFELIQSMCLFFDIIYAYNPSLLINISKPNYKHTKNDKLILHLNTIKQLHLKELKDYIISCVTSVGKRKALTLLFEPFSEQEPIEKMILLSKSIENVYKDIQTILKELNDIVKLHRELSSYSIKMENMNKIVKNYNLILKVLELLNDDCVIFSEFSRKQLIEITSKMITDVTDNINIENIRFFEDSKWNTDELKLLNKTKDELITEFDKEKDKYKIYDINGHFKLELGGLAGNEYYYKITVSRYNQNKELKRAIEKDKLIVINQKSNLKIVSMSLNEKWEIIENISEEINKKTAEMFKQYLKYYILKYKEHFDILKEFVEKIDIALMNNINKTKYNYNPINIKSTGNLSIKDLRHPIIERINNNVQYVSNDINFNSSGTILYGINSSGKSSLIRALGIAIVMGQCGFYVACTKFEIKDLYKNLICQVDLQDDIFKGNSSFITEAIGIKYMLNILEKNEKSMIIADELTRGTENKSAIAIFGATIKRLLSHVHCNFIMTTHLHEISQLKILQDDITNKNLKICNIKVEKDEETGEFIYRRKLEEGTIDPLYGLEIVKSIIGNKIFDPFVKNAEDIRKEICGDNLSLISNNRSRYNKKKIVTKCEICEYKPNKKTDLPLDVHHIKFQCTANEQGFIKDAEYIHKNTKSNLVTLCKECHVKVHKGEITIEGYIQTTENPKIFFKSNL